jgi:hypothetical protein
VGSDVQQGAIGGVLAQAGRRGFRFQAQNGGRNVAGGCGVLSRRVEFTETLSKGREGGQGSLDRVTFGQGARQPAVVGTGQDEGQGRRGDKVTR